MADSAHLNAQDRADFEHALSQALARPEVRAALRERGLDAERARALVRGCAARIADAADDEHEHYRRLRSGAAAPNPPAPPASAGRLSGPLGILALAVPVVAGGSGIVLLLLAAVLSLVESQRRLSGSLRTAALVAGVVAACGAVAGLLGLVVSAYRRRPGPDRGADDPVAEARHRWRTALLEDAMVPFLLKGPASGGDTPTRFRPRYTSPDFAGPDYTSPDFDTRPPP